MFLPNLPGVGIALWATVTCHALAARRTQDALLGLLCASACAVLLGGVLARFVLGAGAARTMWGVAANAATVAYYAGPLSSAAQVVRARDSASIHRPTCIASLVNSALWTGYGAAAVRDPWIAAPNGAGVAITLVLLGLTLAYPRGGSGDGGGREPPPAARDDRGLSAPLQPPS